jgi:eukaryotic translation initiation factor 2C
MQLVLDTTSGAFVHSGTLSEFTVAFLKATSKNPPRSLDVYNLGGPEVNLIGLNRALRQCKLIANRGGNARPVYYKINKEARGIILVTPRDHRFRQNGQWVSVEVCSKFLSSPSSHELTSLSSQDYFLRQFNIRLQNPEWPLIEVKPGVVYPIELVNIDSVRFSMRLF